MAVLLSFSLLASSVDAATMVGQCVFPQTTVAQNGRLKFKNPVYLYSAPDSSSSKSLLTQMIAFTVTSEKNGFIQLKFVEGFDATPDPNAGKIAGWAKRSDFHGQELRNCN